MRIDVLADEEVLVKLGAVLRAYDAITAHLPEIVAAVTAAYPATSRDRLVSGYNEEGVLSFGRHVRGAADPDLLCGDLLDRIENRLESVFERADRLPVALGNCRATAVAPIGPTADLGWYGGIGEALSKACYGQVVSTDHPNLRRTTVLRYGEGQELDVRTNADKQSGTGTVLLRGCYAY